MCAAEQTVSAEHRGVQQCLTVIAKYRGAAVQIVTANEKIPTQAMTAQHRTVAGARIIMA